MMAAIKNKGFGEQVNKWLNISGPHFLYQNLIFVELVLSTRKISPLLQGIFVQVHFPQFDWLNVYGNVVSFLFIDVGGPLQKCRRVKSPLDKLSTATAVIYRAKAESIIPPRRNSSHLNSYNKTPEVNHFHLKATVSAPLIPNPEKIAQSSEKPAFTAPSPVTLTAVALPTLPTPQKFLKWSKCGEVMASAA